MKSSAPFSKSVGIVLLFFASLLPIAAAGPLFCLIVIWAATAFRTDSTRVMPTRLWNAKHRRVGEQCFFNWLIYYSGEYWPANLQYLIVDPASLELRVLFLQTMRSCLKTRIIISRVWESKLGCIYFPEYTICREIFCLSRGIECILRKGNACQHSGLWTIVDIEWR